MVLHPRDVGVDVAPRGGTSLAVPRQQPASMADRPGPPQPRLAVRLVDI